MKKDIAMAWADALESGQYQKTTGCLRSVDKEGNTLGFCCLGVLCNLHAQAHPDVARQQTNPSEYLGECDEPPKAVADWACMHSTIGSIGSYRGGGPYAADGSTGELIISDTRYWNLAAANDRGESFASIAQWIRNNWPLL